jgi:hypothetical protein
VRTPGEHRGGELLAGILVDLEAPLGAGPGVGVVQHLLVGVEVAAYLVVAVLAELPEEGRDLVLGEAVAEQTECRAGDLEVDECPVAVEGDVLRAGEGVGHVLSNQECEAVVVAPRRGAVPATYPTIW